MTDTSFHPSTLVCWRKRIAASKCPDRVFDKVCEIIDRTGILKGRRKRCVDSTTIADAVATQDNGPPPEVRSRGMVEQRIGSVGGATRDGSPGMTRWGSGSCRRASR